MRHDAPAPKFIRAGFHRISGGLKMSPLLRLTLFSEFRRAFVAGDPREEAKAIARALSGRRWRWPWMEWCAGRFSDLGIWPCYWREVGVPNPFSWEAMPQELAQQLLREAIAHAIYSEMRADQLRQPVTSLVFRVGLDYDERCPAHRHVAAHYGERLTRGDFSELPPFFPGDGCSLRAVWRTRSGKTN